uniref:Protein aurora borealis n=1 Tax=Glossina austeni TaxID=7395 RepID=A0A1A9VU42_GLOAU
MDESIESSPQNSHKSVYQKRMHRKRKLQKRSISSSQFNENDRKLRQSAPLDFYDNISEESCLDGPNDCGINKTFVFQKDIALEKNMRRYEDEIMSSADFRPYVQTPIANFDNLTASQKFTSCHELLSQSAELSSNGSEFHITDTELIECCNKAEVMMKEVNDIDAPERARGDNNNKTIVDIIFEDFSSTPFNSPIASPESKLRNLERTPLFILLEKPKRYYSRKFKEKTKLNLEEKFNAAVDDNNDNMSTCSSSLSSLSIQGDFTTIHEHDRSVLPNTSQHLCENLLQISNYFTQSSNSELYLRKEILTSKRKIDDTCEIPPNVVSTIEEILALKSKKIEYLEEEPDICDGDFLGFPESLQYKNDKHLLNVCNQFDDTLIDEQIVNLNSKKSYDSISETADLDYDDIEKEDTYNVYQTLVSSNQCKTGISKNYHWDEDDNDFFASISTQEILDQNVKINNNFPSISKFPGNKQITQAFH